MNLRYSNSPQQICEQILREEKQYNTEHHILSSEVAVADRLLARSLELIDAYEELHGKLYAHSGALQAFLGLILSTAAFWSPKKIAEARTARNDLAAINRQISMKAAELAILLARRSDLHNTSGFSSDTHNHVCNVIEEAARGNALFGWHVQKRFEALHAQFDWKYWPTLSDFLQELASDAEAADSIASDALTEVATAAPRPSLADFFKALFAAIEKNRMRHYGLLPYDFKVTDNTLASLVNCALDLPPEELVDGPYVKRLRQRTRHSAK